MSVDIRLKMTIAAPSSLLSNPVIPAKAGIQRRAHFVGIRIYGIIGFSGFVRRVCDWQALIRIRLVWICGYGKRARWANRNPVNPANPVNPDSDESAQSPPARYFPVRKSQNDVRSSNPR